MVQAVWAVLSSLSILTLINSFLENWDALFVRSLRFWALGFAYQRTDLTIYHAIIFFWLTGNGNKCDKKIDLAVILDVSASIGEENFHLAKDFAKELAKRFALSKNQVRMSVTTYSQYIKIMAKFSDYYDEKSIENTLDKSLYEASSTGTGKTLEAVNFEVFSVKTGARIGRPGKQQPFLISLEPANLQLEPLISNSK